MVGQYYCNKVLFGPVSDRIGGMAHVSCTSSRRVALPNLVTRYPIPDKRRRVKKDLAAPNGSDCRWVGLVLDCSQPSA